MTSAVSWQFCNVLLRYGTARLIGFVVCFVLFGLFVRDTSYFVGICLMTCSFLLVVYDRIKIILHVHYFFMVDCILLKDLQQYFCVHYKVYIYLTMDLHVVGLYMMLSLIYSMVDGKNLARGCDISTLGLHISMNSSLIAIHFLFTLQPCFILSVDVRTWGFIICFQFLITACVELIFTDQ